MKRSSRPQVSIIVVTVNTPRLTRACLQSVRANTSVPYELIVVLNSRAEAIRRCLSRFPEARLLQNPRNLGYTKAANLGIRIARANYLCFLNSDTLVPPGWMERLLRPAREPRVGAVGPISGEEWYTSGHVPPGLPVGEATTALIDSAVRRWNGESPPERVAWLAGCCCLFPRRVFQRIGLFDERFFFGWEDLDYALQLHQKGYRLLKVKSLFVYHQRGGSSNRLRRRRLVRQAERQFLAKWGALLGKEFRDHREVFEAVRGR